MKKVKNKTFVWYLRESVEWFCAGLFCLLMLLIALFILFLAIYGAATGIRHLLGL